MQLCSRVARSAIFVCATLFQAITASHEKVAVVSLQEDGAITAQSFIALDPMDNTGRTLDNFTFCIRLSVASVRDENAYFLSLAASDLLDNHMTAGNVDAWFPFLRMCMTFAVPVMTF